MNSNWLSHGYDRPSNISYEQPDYAYENVEGEIDPGEHDCSMKEKGFCLACQFLIKFNEAKRRNFK